MKYFYLFLVGIAFLMQSFAFASPELLQAAANGNVVEVGRLLDAGADVNYSDQYGYTGLQYAISRRQLAVINLLLDTGCQCEYSYDRK